MLARLGTPSAGIRSKGYTDMTFSPEPMTPELAQRLEAEGYALPAKWPHPARVTTSISERTGWKVVHPGSIKRDDRGRKALVGKLAPEYIAPDSTRLVKVHNGKKPVLVAVSKRLSPSLLALADRQRRPSWAEGCKGEAPESLKAYLLKPGEKLTKGEKRLPVAATGGGGGGVEEHTHTCGHECDGLEPPPALVLALADWDIARRKLAETEAGGAAMVRSLPPRRAILTQKYMKLRTEWALAHAEIPVSEHIPRFHAWLVERVGVGIPIPEPRRSLPRRSRGVPARPRESRDSVIASGKVTIVATPKQLSRRGKWWKTWAGDSGKNYVTCSMLVSPMTKVAYREGMSDRPARWLAPVCIKDMTPEDRDRELARLARRLPDFTQEERSA